MTAMPPKLIEVTARGTDFLTREMAPQVGQRYVPNPLLSHILVNGIESLWHFGQIILEKLYRSDFKTESGCKTEMSNSMRLSYRNDTFQFSTTASRDIHYYCLHLLSNARNLPLRFLSQLEPRVNRREVLFQPQTIALQKYKVDRSIRCIL
jgi:hypothetical protein